MKVIKRNGTIVDFNGKNIYNAIKKAYSTVYPIDTEAETKIANITKKVIIDLEELSIEQVPITIIQSVVESRLLDFGMLKVAEAYIDYRIQRDIERYGFGDKINVKFHLETIG